LEWSKEKAITRSSLLFVVEPEKRTHAMVDINLLEKIACGRYRTDIWAF
jgi:hypothetical protein